MREWGAAPFTLCPAFTASLWAPAVLGVLAGQGSFGDSPCLQPLICCRLWGRSCLGVLEARGEEDAGGCPPLPRPCSVSLVTNPPCPPFGAFGCFPPSVWSRLSPLPADGLVEFLRCSDRKSLALQVLQKVSSSSSSVLSRCRSFQVSISMKCSLPTISFTPGAVCVLLRTFLLKVMFLFCS